MSQPVIKLLGPAWTRAFRCIWMLEELGVEYENVPASNPWSKTVKAHSASGKVPVLLEYDSPTAELPSFVLCESVAINTYLAERYGTDPTLVPPAGTRERAKYDEVTCCVLSELDAQGTWIQRKHGDLGEFFGNIPAAVEAAEKQFASINKVLAEQCQPYLLGDTFTAADILYAHTLDWSKACGWDKDWPANIPAYRQLYQQRPAYQRAVALRKESLIEKAKLEEKIKQAKM